MVAGIVLAFSLALTATISPSAADWSCTAESWSSAPGKEFVAASCKASLVDCQGCVSTDSTTYTWMSFNGGLMTSCWGLTAEPSGRTPSGVSTLCSFVAPVDCVHGQWGPWSSCSKTCGKGTTSRMRPILNETQYGGMACSPTETSDCNEEMCPDTKDEKCKNTMKRKFCYHALMDGKCGDPEIKKGCQATCRACCGNIWRDKKCNKRKVFCNRQPIKRRCRKTCGCNQ